MRTTRVLVLAILSALFVLLALPAMAATEEEPPPEDDASQEEIVSDYDPVVEVEIGTEPAEADAPWTTRFLVPTSLILGGLAVFVTVVQYFLRVVRTRYKVVE